MTVTREELAAYADGELEAPRAATVAAAIEADPALAEQVRLHRRMKDRLAARFDPILEEPVPDRLTAMVRPEAEIVDFAAARERRMRRWVWIAAPALAASLALAIFLPGGADYAGGELEAALDTQLAASQAADADTRILLSFRDADGEYCRAFAAVDESGIACRDGEGWRLEYQGEGVPLQSGEFRMAGSAEVLERAQNMASGPALDAGQEQAARARGWR